MNERMSEWMNEWITIFIEGEHQSNTKRLMRVALSMYVFQFMYLRSIISLYKSTAFEPDSPFAGYFVGDARDKTEH
jgi:hypothetical protein